MSLEQKYSWFIVASLVIALITFLLLVPLVGVKVAWGALGLCGLGGLAPLIFRKKPGPAEVTADERDRMIVQKAAMIAGIVALETVLAVCMIPWFIYMLEGKQVISITILPFITFAWGIIFWVTRSIAILILYGRESRDV